MTEQQKIEITTLLAAWVERYPSRNKAAVALGVAAATLSAMLNNDWAKISDAMWSKVQAAISAPTRAQDWQIAATTAYKEIEYVMRDAQENSAVTWIVGDAGCGKTTASKQYADENRNVFYVLCQNGTTPVDLMRDIAKAMGIRVDGPVRQMMEQIREALSRIGSPLLVFDEADKLADSVMRYFITIYNCTEGFVGIVFLSTQHIKRRMVRGLELNKRGYQELHSRIGRKFFELERLSATDVYIVCVANGLKDESAINEVIREAETYQYDMRRVHKVARVKLKNRAA